MNYDSTNPQQSSRAQWEAQRKGIDDIEITLDTTRKRDLNDGSVAAFVDRITAVRKWVRSSENSNQTYEKGQAAVLNYLRNAGDKLDLAREEYKKKGYTAKFLEYIEKGRQELENALKAWGR